MAVRRVTHSYPTIVDFLTDHQGGTLGQGALLLPAAEVQGELAPELKLDLVIPLLGRLGPIDAQVVHRGSDGAVALRIVEWPPAVKARIDELLLAVEQLKAHWKATAPRPVASAGAVGAAPQGGMVAEPVRGRGIPVPDLSQQTPALAGQATFDEYRALFTRLAVEKRQGILTIEEPGGRVRRAFFSAGGPVAWRTDPIEESEVLGVLLYKAEQIDREQLARSLEIMQREGLRQGDALISMGVLSFPQLVMVLGKQAEFILTRVLQEPKGTWTFHDLPALPERFLPTPLRVPAILFRMLFQQARAMKGDSVYEELAAHLDSYVYLPDASNELMPEMRFAPPEQRLVDTIRGGSWRLRELYAVSPMSRALTAAMMLALGRLGFVAYKQEQDDARLFAGLASVLARKKAQVHKGSLFEVLEVHWICVTEEVEAAYERLYKEYDPVRFRRMGEEAEADAQKIRARLDEGRRILADEHRRREYRKEVIEETKIVQSAELLDRQGEMAFLRNDRRAALTCYSKAAELVPGNAAYRAALQRAKGLSG